MALVNPPNTGKTPKNCALIKKNKPLFYLEIPATFPALVNS